MLIHISNPLDVNMIIHKNYINTHIYMRMRMHMCNHHTFLFMKKVCVVTSVSFDSIFSLVSFFMVMATEWQFHSHSNSSSNIYSITTCLLVLSLFSFRFIYLRIMYTFYIQMRKHRHTHTHSFLKSVHRNIPSQRILHVYMKMVLFCFCPVFFIVCSCWMFSAKHAMYDNVFWHSHFAYCMKTETNAYDTPFMLASVQFLLCIQFAIE